MHLCLVRSPGKQIPRPGQARPPVSSAGGAKGPEELSSNVTFRQQSLKTTTAHGYQLCLAQRNEAFVGKLLDWRSKNLLLEKWLCLIPALGTWQVISSSIKHS